MGCTDFSQGPIHGLGNQGLNILRQGKTWYKHDYQERELSGRVLVSKSRGCGFKPHRPHWVVSLSKTH